MVDSSQADRDLAAGHAALSRGAWLEARSWFEKVLVAGEAPEALEGLSWAAWWLEDVAACLDARERAYRHYRDAGDSRGAARMALWLGDDHVEFRGAYAVAGGWLRRAARILEELEPCPEHGWLAVLEAHAALERHDLAGARRLAEQARASGHRHGAVDLEMFALASEGVARVEQGEVAEGLRCLDEAAASALSGEYENLAPAAWACCLMMSTCERLRDYDRASQWCRQIEAFSRRMDARFLTGVCRAHYGVVQAWQGNWDHAERELVEALGDLTANRPSWRQEALVRLGELRRGQGRLTEAGELFEQAAEHPMAQRGMAALSLDRDDPATARDLLERVLRQVPPDSGVARSDALELLVRACLALGDHESAADRLHELQVIASATATPPLRARVRFCEGLLAAATGEHEQARDRLEDAVALFTHSRARVERARARVALSAALLELGRAEAAEREAHQALADLDDIDAAVERARAEALVDRLRARRVAPRGRDELLTARQVEVLRLVADGLSDRQIAERLVLSPHTVHRHVANIYTRLDCSSRPAAVAEASRRGLL